MVHYYIIKTDSTGSELIGTGCYETKNECLEHWTAYTYGFMDCAILIYGRHGFGMYNGLSSKQSFYLRIPDKKEVEYFMLLDKDGEDFIAKICNQPK